MTKSEETQLTIKQKLQKIQVELDAPKSQYNSFGKYPYRNVEDIQEGLKPLLEKYECAVTLSDRVVQVGDRYYVEATATLKHDGDDQEESVTAYAREDNDKKGMDLSQLTGSTSSYARKYALGGLFAIDDNKDADSQDNRANKTAQAPAKPAPKAPAKPEAVTTAQLGLMYGTMKEKGYTDKAEVTAILHKIAQVNSLTELTKVKASNVLAALKEADKAKLDSYKD